jgi:hypothetical protein
MSSQLCQICKGPCKCTDWIASPSDKKQEKDNKKQTQWESFFKVDETRKQKKYNLQSNYVANVIQAYIDNSSEIKKLVNALPHEDAVLCVMFFEENGVIKFDSDASGNSAGLVQIFKYLRNISGADNSSETYCAEENIIRQKGGNKYLFSLAFRKKVGIIPPCKKCKAILGHYKIYFLNGEGWDVIRPW